VVGIDAVLVLSGAVLTSFVGVGGLMERMALDRILPRFLLKKNKRGSSYWIYILFFILCSSIMLVTEGDLAKLAGVYTIAFLSVMVLFGIGNLLLKVNRSRLPRPEKASWPALIVAILSVGLAIIGNIYLNPHYLTIFLEYLIPTLLVVFFMLKRTFVFKIFLYVIEYLFPDDNKFFDNLNDAIKIKIHKINGQQFIFFTNHDDVSTLNKVMLYIKDNEATRKLKIVTVLDEGQKPNENLIKDIEVLNRAYPTIHIEFVAEYGKFGPEKIQELSKKWRIPTNFMFIGAPGEKFAYRIQQLGEVRLII